MLAKLFAFSKDKRRTQRSKCGPNQPSQVPVARHHRAGASPSVHVKMNGMDDITYKQTIPQLGWWTLNLANLIDRGVFLSNVVT